MPQRRRTRQLARQGLTFGVTLIAVIVTTSLLRREPSSGLGGAAILASVVAVVYLAGSSFIEDRPPPELRAAKGIVPMLVGLGVGVALFSLVMISLWLLTAYHPSGGGTASRLGMGFVAALLTGALEETLFRGVLYRLVSTLAGTWGAIGITSALFGFAHAFNPHATIVSSVAIAFEAGVLLAAAYVRTGSLWLPIGLHAGWNFTERDVFGMVESGGFRNGGLIEGTLRGPTLLTGGAFGPEASVVAVVVCLAAAGVLLWQITRLGLVQPPLWRSEATATTTKFTSGAA